MAQKNLPKLYIIHGWTYTVAPWETTLDLLKKQGVEVEMLHVPGLTAPSRKVWTIEDYVKWADRRIPKDAVVLGHSNGGRILLNLSSQKPDKFKHLILLDSAGVYYEVDKKRDMARNLSKKLSFLKKVPGVEKVWHKLIGASDYDRAPANMKKTLSNMLESDKKLDLTKVTVPTSILWGAADTVTPPRQAEVMHERIPHNTLEMFEGWTHAPYISHPQELAKVIYKTLKRPPKIKPVVADTTKNSAALAIKKAPEPTLKTQDSGSEVVSSVPTKLVLHKDEKLTDGMVATDAEGAAVRYDKDLSKKTAKVTNVQANSASAGFRKASTERDVPDTDSVVSSASASLKKAKPTEVEDPSKRSASLSLLKGKRKTDAEDSETRSSLLEELAESTEEKVDFMPLGSEGKATSTGRMITSSSVPKVGRLEKAKRKISSKKSHNRSKTKRGKK